MAEEYKVTRTDRISVTTPEGIPQMGYRVWFTIHGIGVYDFVDVVERDHTPDKVKALIVAKVEIAREIFGS